MRRPGQHKLSRLFFVVLCSLISGNTLNAQNTGIYKKIYYTIYISNSGSTDFLKDKSIHKSSLHSLQNFYKDKSARSRAKAYEIARNIYNYAEDPTIRSQVINDHLKACQKDRSPSLRFQLANHLIHFDKEYFDEEAINSMRELIETDAHKKQYIVIAGYKGMDEVLPAGIDFQDEDIYESWDIIQALARVGNPEAVDMCRKIVKEHPLNIRFFDELLPGLVFTNDLVIFDAIIDEILNDNTELIGSRIKDYQRYFMMKHILPLINEYPYRFVEESQLTRDEFYQQLHFAIDWLQKNKDAYTLINYETPMRSKSSPYISGELSLFDY